MVLDSVQNYTAIEVNIGVHEILTEACWCPPGPPSIENGAHGTEKLLLKFQVSEYFA